MTVEELRKLFDAFEEEIGRDTDAAYARFKAYSAKREAEEKQLATVEPEQKSPQYNVVFSEAQIPPGPAIDITKRRIFTTEETSPEPTTTPGAATGAMPMKWVEGKWVPVNEDENADKTRRHS